MHNNWCGEEQYQRNRAETKEAAERRDALRLNPLVFHNYFDVLAMARHGDKSAVAELHRRDAIENARKK